MPFPAPGLLALLLPALLLAPLPAAADADSGADAEALRCFELRDANPAGAVKVAETALAAPGIGEQARIKLLACLGRSAALAGDAAKAESAVAEMSALLADRQVPPEFALRALSNAGATLHSLGRIGPALEYYARAYEAARQSESDLAQVAMLSNVASIHSEALDAYDQAEAYYARATAVQQRAGEADALLPYNRGSNYRRMGRVDDALAAFAAAERAAADSGQEVLLQRARAERLALEALQGPGTGDADVARTQLLEIAQRQRALEDATGAAGTLLRLSHLALRRGDPADALVQAQHASELLPKTEGLAEHREALAAQLAALTALERWREALEASEALRALEGAHARGVELGALASMQAKLEDTRSGEELQRLQEERRIEALRMAHAARLRNGALVGVGALILLVAAFVWYQRGVTARLRRLSTIDGLTGLLNRRAASRLLDLEGPGPARGARRNVVFLIDIDHFKSRNAATAMPPATPCSRRSRGSCGRARVRATWSRAGAARNSWSAAADWTWPAPAPWPNACARPRHRPVRAGQARATRCRYRSASPAIRSARSPRPRRTGRTRSRSPTARCTRPSTAGATPGSGSGATTTAGFRWPNCWQTPRPTLVGGISRWCRAGSRWSGSRAPEARRAQASARRSRSAARWRRLAGSVVPSRRWILASPVSSGSIETSCARLTM